MVSTTLDAERIRQVIDERRFSTLFEPTYSLQTGRVVGLEARTGIARSPVTLESWVSAAQDAGLALELELAATRHALSSATGLDGPLWLGIQLSPETMLDPRAHDLLATCSPRALGSGGGGIVVHHPAVRHPTDLHAHPGPPSGQVAIGRAFTCDLATSRRRRLHARRIITTAHRLGLRVIAEGVETPTQLRRWGQLGADAVRGLLLAAPSSLATALGAGPIAARPERRDQAPGAPGSRERTTCRCLDRSRRASDIMAS